MRATGIEPNAEDSPFSSRSFALDFELIAQRMYHHLSVGLDVSIYATLSVVYTG